MIAAVELALMTAADSLRHSSKANLDHGLTTLEEALASATKIRKEINELKARENSRAAPSLVVESAGFFHRPQRH